MSMVKTVAQAGATGALGTAVLKELVDAGFKVRALSRQVGKVPPAYSNQVKEIAVNYDDPASLKSALDGVDAVVSTLGAAAVGEQQRALVDAAADVGVKRFIPSNFGCDHQNALTRRLPVFSEKVKTEDYLVNKSKSSSLSYTFVYNNLFLDWGLDNGFLANIKGQSVVLYNHGDLAVSVTRLSTVGKGVVGVLKNLDATRNRAIRIEDGKLSFKTIAALAQRALPGQWAITEADTDELKEASDEALKAGTLDGWVWANYILHGGTNVKYGPSFASVDNDLLGLGRLSDEQLQDLVEELIIKASRQ